MDRSQLLIGRIAQEMGYITAEALEECVVAQRLVGPDVALGQVFVERRLLTPGQLDEVLEIQRERFAEQDPHTFEKLEDILFGRLLVREGLVDEREVRAALRDQAAMDREGRPSEFRYLGELLVERGVMRPEDVARVLKLQRKDVLYCGECLVQYNVVDFAPGTEVRCRTCQGILSVPPVMETTAGAPADPSVPGQSSPIP